MKAMHNGDFALLLILIAVVSGTISGCQRGNGPSATPSEIQKYVEQNPSDDYDNDALSGPPASSGSER